MSNSLDYFLVKLETSMADGAVLLASRDDAQTLIVRQRCVDAVMLVGAYQLFVHRELFEPLMRDGGDYHRRAACDLKAECIMLTQDLRDSVKAFMADDAPLDWDQLTARVHGFNAVVRAHIAKVRALTASMAALPAWAA